MYLPAQSSRQKKTIEEATALPLAVVEEHPVEITEAKGAGNAQKKEAKHKKYSAAISFDKT